VKTAELTKLTEVYAEGDHSDGRRRMLVVLDTDTWQRSKVNIGQTREPRMFRNPSGRSVNATRGLPCLVTRYDVAPTDTDMRDAILAAAPLVAASLVDGQPTPDVPATTLDVRLVRPQRIVSTWAHWVAEAKIRAEREGQRVAAARERQARIAAARVELGDVLTASSLPFALPTHSDTFVSLTWPDLLRVCEAYADGRRVRDLDETLARITSMEGE
jgi:hypothetical protein